MGQWLSINFRYICYCKHQKRENIDNLYQLHVTLFGTTRWFNGNEWRKYNKSFSNHTKVLNTDLPSCLTKVYGMLKITGPTRARSPSKSAPQPFSPCQVTVVWTKKRALLMVKLSLLLVLSSASGILLHSEGLYLLMMVSRIPTMIHTTISITHTSPLQRKGWIDK